MSGTAAPGERAAPAALQPGQILGARFRLVEAIGRGGFGDVWRAEELLPNGSAIRQVALKLLSPETDVSAWGEEAKLLASFSHPSLVTILAAGLLAPGEGAPVPFVAMELLAGETLGALFAREGRVPWRRVLAWAREVAAALDVIHARGVVHLDLKPSNLFLTTDGALKVLDFGIARRAGLPVASPGAAPAADDGAMATAEFLAERGPPPSAAAPASAGRRSSRSVVGTPGFMAPEVIEQRAATPAADAYAFAACVVQLATGKLPQDVPDAPPSPSDPSRRQAFLAELRLATMAGRLRDLEAAGLPRGVAAICRRLLALDPGARGIAPGELRATIEAAWERPFGVPDPPYLGLDAFGPELEGMLFGRDDDVTRLGRELERRAAVVLQGVSGSGKSSLAMAGIVPFLAKRDAATRAVRAVVVRPGPDPDRALAAALGAIAPELAEAGVAAIAEHAGARSEGLVFVTDQLEELSTQAAPAARGRFVAFLTELAALPPSSPLRLIGTLREDFTSELLAIEPLGEALRDALRFVGPPTAAAVREIVAEPARLAGATVEGLSEVAADVQRELRAGDGRLPLVALALAAWWDTREEGPGGPVLGAGPWRELGGVRKIFADLADGVFAGLDAAAQREARAALVELCHDNRTRRTVRRAELRAAARDPAAFDRALRAFVDRRLVVVAGAGREQEGGDEGEARLEVVHEFLFTAWDRLDGWLTDARSSRRVAAALREDARTWVDLGRPATRLPSPHEIALAEIALSEGSLAGADADLVRSWLAARRSRARWSRLKAAAVATVLFASIAAALAAWGQTVSVAQARADQAKREAHDASLKMIDNQQRAAEAQRDADRSREESERVAMIARRQQEEFERLLREAESEVKRSRVRCGVVENASRIRSGGCPPGDPLCSSVPSSLSGPSGFKGSGNRSSRGP